MKKTQKILIVVGLFVLAAIWAIVAFGIKEDTIPRFSLWADLVFGSGTIMVSVLALLISISSYRRTEILRKEKLTEEADKFISENNDEILYIPLCLIANAYDKHHKFIRKIYNNFNVLNIDLQKEILKQLNYEPVLIGNDSWINIGLKRVENFIEENDLGNNYLYDGAKYYHNAIRFPENSYSEADEFVKVFPDNFRYLKKYHFDEKGAPYTEKISFDDYVWSFLNMKSRNDPLYIANKDKKPIDYLYALLEMNEMHDDDFAFWMMVVVDCVAYTIMRESNKKEEIAELSKGDAEIQNFEDRYLLSLMVLYNLSKYN